MNWNPLMVPSSIPNPLQPFRNILHSSETDLPHYSLPPFHPILREWFTAKRKCKISDRTSWTSATTPMPLSVPTSLFSSMNTLQLLTSDFYIKATFLPTADSPPSWSGSCLILHSLLHHFLYGHDPLKIILLSPEIIVLWHISLRHIFFPLC